jgi:hypothetical protein
VDNGEMKGEIMINQPVWRWANMRLILFNEASFSPLQQSEV